VTVRGDASQYTHTYGYDAQGDQTSESTPPMTTTLNGSTTTAPVTTTEGYDGDGNRVSTISANGNTTTLAYDHLGRQTSATLPPVTLYDGSATTPVERTGYDGDGNVARTTDATGATTTSVYDPLGRQTSTTNPVSGTATTRYNATEAVAAQDMAGNVTTSAYDGAGRLVQASDAVTGTTRYGYDAAGNTVAITAGDTSGAVTQLETRGYDAWDHAITDTMAAPASPALTTLTAYDRDGNVAQTEQPQGDTTYATYDLADQPAEELIYARPVGQAGSDGGGRWGRATGAGGGSHGRSRGACVPSSTPAGRSRNTSGAVRASWCTRAMAAPSACARGGGPPPSTRNVRATVRWTSRVVGSDGAPSSVRIALASCPAARGACAGATRPAATARSVVATSASRAAMKAARLCALSKAPRVSTVSAVMRISSLGGRRGAGVAGESCYIYSTNVLG
jgi:YD repeat-containing protein